MGKRLLAGFLAMCLLLGGCSANRGSSASLVDGSSSDEMHTVICWIANNGHLMDVQISVPLSWEVSQEKNWKQTGKPWWNSRSTLMPACQWI